MCASHACPLPPTLHSSPPRARRLCPPTGPRPSSRAFRPAPRPSSHALLPTRQGATAFNQQLTFDTSSVTVMGGMFDVRSPRVLCAQPSNWVRVRAACAAAAPRLSSLALQPASRPAPHALLSTRQNAKNFNQPLSLNTSSVTDFTYMFAVRSPRACPVPKSHPPRARRLRHRCHTPCRLPARISSSVASPPFDSAGRKLLVRCQ